MVKQLPRLMLPSHICSRKKMPTLLTSLRKRSSRMPRNLTAMCSEVRAGTIRRSPEWELPMSHDGLH